jgi:hypothetical protein
MTAQSPINAPEEQPSLFPQENPRWLAFDLETAKVLAPDDGDLMRSRPLGIICAAALSSDGELTTWVEKDERGYIQPRLSAGTAAGLVSFLQEHQTAGWRIVTWNGLGFDFDILYEESGYLPACKDLAREHTDMMFHVFCEKGYPVSLEKAARGMGLAGKTDGMKGAFAPAMWQQGEHEAVLKYLEQDVRITLALALAGERERTLRWISGTDKLLQLRLPRGWLPVKDAQALPLPDVEWMKGKAPWTREKFTGWLKG